MADVTITCSIQKTVFFWKNLNRIEGIIWEEISKVRNSQNNQAVEANDFLLSLQPKFIFWSLSTKKKKTNYDAKILIQTSDTYLLEETLKNIRIRLLALWPNLKIELPDLRYNGWQATHYPPIE